MDSLIFVYNADSGLLNAARDWWHKIRSPETYTCSLCTLTYGHLGMRSEWRRFVASLPVQTEFLHADEMRQRHPGLAHPLPAAYGVRADHVSLRISAAELNACADLGQLMALVERTLESSNDALSL